MFDLGLKDRTAIVTGANHGIGSEIAKSLADQGAKVFLTYFRQYPEEYGYRTEDVISATEPGMPLYHAERMKTAEHVVEAIRSAGGVAESWEADLGEVGNITELFDRAESAFGKVEILINNAAYWKSDCLLDESQLITEETHDRHFAINSRAVAITMSEFAKRQIKRQEKWGRIINISTDGASSFPGEISYGASKHALESYSRAAAIQFGPHGITVNIVSPGPVQTDYISPIFEQELIPQIPLRRIGKPEDIANAVIFFASELASWITGQLLYVGGGHLMPL